MAQSEREREAKKQEIREKVCEQFASDNLTPDEVVLMDNHDIVIDRRKRYPWAKTMVIGKWS
ncbi:hypothetical protein ACFY05_31795 [Microtetraspora fusca]|uniref:Uncharacterized protein n=1 Tax=Microtetraspora fusca TaxID=1997 RepID=A0ABW6VEN0_MICFU